MYVYIIVVVCIYNLEINLYLLLGTMHLFKLDCVKNWEAAELDYPFAPDT